MMVQLAGYLAVAVVLFIVIRSLRNGAISERYAILWLLLSGAVLAVLLYPDLLSILARILGIAVPANLLFMVSLALLTAITLHLTWEQSRSEQRIRRLAEEVAILDARLAETEKRLGPVGDEKHPIEESDDEIGSP